MESAEVNKGLDRMLGLTDDVFAFAITLLVLDIVTPVIFGPTTNSSLAGAITQQWQSFLGYVVSFWVIGMHWLEHHRIFRFIKGYDNGLLSLNLLYLFFIVLIPFATRVLDNYESLQLAIIIFAAVQIGASLTNVFTWRYATSNRRLVNMQVSDLTISWYGIRGLIGPLIFAVSMLLSFIQPYVGIASWFAVAPAHMLLDRRQAKRLSEAT